MRILAFYPYIPYPLDRGAFYRGFYLLRALAKAHQVDLLALAENGEGMAHRSVFGAFCRRVEFVSFHHPPWPKLFPERLRNPLPTTVAHWTLPQAADALQRALAREPYDAVHMFDLILAQYPVPEGIPLAVDRTRVDLQYQLMERRRHRFRWKSQLLDLENLLKLRAYERRVAQRTQLQVVCGPDDEQFLRRYVRRSLDIAVIPNGVDSEFFHPPAAPDQERSAAPALLFCGAMDYAPNVDALRWFFAAMHAPLARMVPDLEVWIVGRSPVPEVQAFGRLPNVTVTGGVPDVRPFYRRAWLQSVPLRIGGGTRLKIVECMAMGTPVLSTTIGAQGLKLQHDREILLADSAEAFVAQAVRALRSADLRERLSCAGLRAVRSNLSWPVLGDQLTAVYADRFDRKTSRPAMARAPAVEVVP